MPSADIQEMLKNIYETNMKTRLFGGFRRLSEKKEEAD